MVPVPVREKIAGELPASLTREADPLAVPLACGEKAKLKEVVAPAAMVKGVATLVLKPLPVTVADETTTLAVPLLERITFCELLEPKFTFPNDNDGGEMLSSPTAVATPVPLKETTFGDPLTLLAIDAVPLALPVVLGLKATVAL